VSEWLTVTRLGDLDLVRLAGEVDLATAGGIEEELAGALRASSAVVLDLTAVSFLDSAAIRALDGIVGDLQDRGAVVRLVAPGGAARMALRLWAFPDELIHPDLAGAAAAVGA
jgi:anti-sigma B factor antagonist